MVTVYGRRFQPAGLIPHDLPLVYCKPHAMLPFRLVLRGWRAAARLRRQSVMRNERGMQRETGARSPAAPRSGARRAATKRGNPPAGVDGAWSLSRCACNRRLALPYVEKKPALCGAGFLHDATRHDGSCRAAADQNAMSGAVCLPIVTLSMAVYTLRPKKNGRPQINIPADGAPRLS